MVAREWQASLERLVELEDGILPDRLDHGDLLVLLCPKVILDHREVLDDKDHLECKEV